MNILQKTDEREKMIELAPTYEVHGIV